MGTRSDIIVHRADGKWARIYCHWDGYLAHNGQILFDHYTSQGQAEALVALGNLSILGKDSGKPPRGHSYDKKAEGYCVAYSRDRKPGVWCEEVAKTKAELVASEAAVLGDTLQAVWPGDDCGTELTYVWEGDKWWVGDPDEGPQALVDLGEALSGKAKVTPAVKAFGGNFVIGKHKPLDPSDPDITTCIRG